jgi:hypothetical protein
MVILIGITLVAEGTYAGIGWGVIVFGLAGVASGIGLYRQVRWARPAAGVAAFLTMVLSAIGFLFAGFFEVDTWVFVAIGVAFAGSITVLIAAGLVIQAIFWILTLYYGGNSGGDSGGSPDGSSSI